MVHVSIAGNFPGSCFYFDTKLTPGNHLPVKFCEPESRFRTRRASNLPQSICARILFLVITCPLSSASPRVDFGLTGRLKGLRRVSNLPQSICGHFEWEIVSSFQGFPSAAGSLSISSRKGWCPYGAAFSCHNLQGIERQKRRRRLPYLSCIGQCLREPYLESLFRCIPINIFFSMSSAVFYCQHCS